MEVRCRILVKRTKAKSTFGLADAVRDSQRSDVDNRYQFFRNELRAVEKVEVELVFVFFGNGLNACRDIRLKT